MADVIIVPGRGILPDGSLPPDPVARVERAVELYKEQKAPYIIMSGHWTFIGAPVYPRSEAAAMKELAVKLGVPAAHVLVEDESVDTIGNAYYVKKSVLVPRGSHDIILVAGPDHAPRVMLTFKWVLGPSYQLDMQESRNALKPEEYAAKIKEEGRLARVMKKLFYDQAPAGDDEAIIHLLQDLHPAYSDHARYTVEDLKTMVDAA